ncbi:MAG: Dephospho-CoA kinase [Deltaproteobacteria bacterium ADurb.Bin510]|jgi:dephospho-CoA kinase|nr:MAG: Dephospho-CoA kinase [Deltaproteobacteria bacterium ADurb.Bin510]
MLRELGASVVCADEVAHAVSAPGGAAYLGIVQRFGCAVLNADATIDRERLGQVVFGDEQARADLNAITHPAVFAELFRQAAAATTPVVILDVPLLIETGLHTGLAEVILVYAPPAVQLERLMCRNQLSEAAAQARIASQLPIDEKRASASIVIDNSGDLATTRAQVEQAYAYLLTLA